MQDSRGDVNDCARLYGLALIADNHDAPARINEYDFIRIFVRVNRNPSHGVCSQRVPVALVIDCSIPVGENVARRLPLKDDRRAGPSFFPKELLELRARPSVLLEEPVDPADLFLVAGQGAPIPRIEKIQECE